MNNWTLFALIKSRKESTKNIIKKKQTLVLLSKTCIKEKLLPKCITIQEFFTNSTSLVAFKFFSSLFVWPNYKTCFT